MRLLKKFTLLIALCFNSTIQAQIVSTVAGVLETAGARDGAPFQALFNNPHGIAADSVGNVFVADRFGHLIRKITPDGTVTTIAGTGQPGSANGPGETASFNEPWGICVAKNGDVFVADTRNNLIRKITPDGLVSTVAGTGNFGVANGPALVATFGNPTGIETDNKGNLYVADHLTHLIRRIDANGLVHTLAGTAFTPGTTNGTGSNARFYRPYGLTLDLEGNILVADEWNHLIRKITPAGNVSTFAGTGQIGNVDGDIRNASFNFPWDITVDKYGNIFVADGFNHIIRRIDPADNVSTYVGLSGTAGGVDGEGADARFSGATGLAYVALTNEIFVADAYNNLIRKISRANPQEVGLQMLSPLNGSLCEGDELKVRAFPEAFTFFRFFIDGEEVAASENPFFSTTSILPGEHQIIVQASFESESFMSAEVPVMIHANPIPLITVIGESSFTQGDSAILQSSTASHYFWNTADTTASIIVRESGIFQVEVEDQFGCVGSSDTVSITAVPFVLSPAIVFAEGDEVLCFGEKATLQSNYSQHNQWYKNGLPLTGETTAFLEVESAGIYQIQVSDDFGNAAFSTELTITQQPRQIIDFSADQETILLGESLIHFTAEVQGAVNYFWDFDDGFNSTEPAPQKQFFSPGVFSVSLFTSDIFGCRDTLFKADFIEVKKQPDTDPEPQPDELSVFIPTAFTPNGDHSNDVFYVRGNNIASLNLAICNQWGELIFQTADQQQGWAGDFRGQDAQEGTYTYVATVVLNTGQTQHFAGHITLIR